MPETNDNSSPEITVKVPLTVLPHSGKAEQLRREALAATEARNPRPQAQAPMTNETAVPSGPNVPPPSATGDSSPAIRKKLLEAKIISVLHTIYDPEIPISIYELGLIYDIDIHDDDSVTIRMTLTSPGCPVAGSLPGEVERKVEAVPEVKSAEVVLAWDPPWSRERMSEAALLQLGML